jgi:hypothetical protein
MQKNNEFWVRLFEVDEKGKVNNDHGKVRMLNNFDKGAISASIKEHLLTRKER